MKKRILFSLILFMFISAQSQELFLSTGRNFTTYDYKNDDGETNPNIKGSSASFYELGYVFSINEKVALAASLTLNGFDATGGDYVNNYSWSTNYLGAQGVFKYAIFQGSRSNFGLFINAGFNLSHIINGNQKINGQTYNLTSNEEFKGVFIKPLVGIDTRYFITNEIAFGLGYNISKSFGVFNNSPQKLNFNNQQIQFNLFVSIN